MSELIKTSELLDRVENDLELLGEMVAIFEDERASYLENLEKAIESGNAEDLDMAAHTIKGVLANLSAAQTAEIAKSLEELGKTGSTDGAQEMYEKLKQEIELVSEALQKIIAS